MVVVAAAAANAKTDETYYNTSSQIAERERVHPPPSFCLHVGSDRAIIGEGDTQAIAGKWKFIN